MKPLIVCVGKLREAYWRDAASEYVKRLARFGGVDIAECADLPEPKNASESDIRRVLDAEGTSILAQVGPRDHVIALCVDGKMIDSPALADRLRQIEDGAKRPVFIIGGSNGLSQAVIRRADERISFSPMTFPHQLARVVLLEQLYRARKIVAGETYHK